MKTTPLYPLSSKENRFPSPLINTPFGHSSLVHHSQAHRILLIHNRSDIKLRERCPKGWRPLACPKYCLQRLGCVSFPPSDRQEQVCEFDGQRRLRGRG